jgi:hypothetical protein
MTRSGLWLGLFIAAILHSTTATARHLEGRTGMGVTLHDFDYTPSVSLRYHMSNYQSVVLLAGFNTEDTKHSLVLGGKLIQNVHLEENMNFYVGIGGFLIADRAGFPTTSGGIELSGFFGGEFFLTGLPNLGISFETGVAMRTVRQVSFATLGNGFLGAAVHYYF